MSIMEKMEEALDPSAFDAEASLSFVPGKTICRRIARTTLNAALTATGLTEAQLEGLANGDLVILPNPLKARERADAVADRAMLAAKEG